MSLKRGSPTRPDPGSESDRGPLLRGIAFALILGFIFVGPLYRQVLGGENPLFRRWTMYRARGLEIADAKFYRRLPGGALEPIDRFVLLGYEEPGAAPDALRRIRGPEETREIARQLCRALGFGADVRAVTHWGTASGWEPGYAAEENLCETEAPAPQTEEREP